jgi:hypothetical protein
MKKKRSAKKQPAKKEKFSRLTLLVPSKWLREIKVTYGGVSSRLSPRLSQTMQQMVTDMLSGRVETKLKIGDPEMLDEIQKLIEIIFVEQSIEESPHV